MALNMVLPHEPLAQGRFVSSVLFSSAVIGQEDGYSISSPGSGASLAFPSRRSRLGFFPTQSQEQAGGTQGVSLAQPPHKDPF